MLVGILVVWIDYSVPGLTFRWPLRARAGTVTTRMYTESRRSWSHMTEHRLEFRDSEHPWAPTAAVAEINARTGSGLELVGLDVQTGGTSGAAYVRWPDGRDGVLTRSAISLDWMRRTAEVLSRLRSVGLPVPRHDLVISLSDGRLAVVQERMPGRPASWVDAGRIDAMVRANEQLAGVLREDMPELPNCGASSGDDYHRWCRALTTHGDRSRRLLRRIQEIERSAPSDLPGSDLVHPDYGLGNVLFDASGAISGIIDWNGGACRGDFRFALLTLCNNLAAEGDQYGASPDARTRLDAILGRIEPEVLRLYWARWTLVDVAQSIGERFPPSRIEHDLERGEARLF